VVSRPRGQAGVDGQAGVCGGLRLGRLSGASSVETGGPCSHRGHGSWCGARPDTGPESLLPQAPAASECGQRVGVLWYGYPDRLCGNRSGLPQTPPDASTVAVRDAVQVPDTADGLRRLVSPGGAAATETRLPGLRPLVG
jgi:hypothetical protein